MLETFDPAVATTELLGGTAYRCAPCTNKERCMKVGSKELAGNSKARHSDLKKMAQEQKV